VVEGWKVADERAQEALAHLQRAALEVIAAVRALLDVAEEAVREPGGVLSVISDTAKTAREASGRGGGPTGSRRSAEPTGSRRVRRVQVD